MCDLSCDVNNRPKKILKLWNTLTEIYMGNTIEYDVKSYQVKTIIVKCTKVYIKILKFNYSHKKTLGWPMSMWRNKINLNKKRSPKRFQIWIGKLEVPDLKYTEGARNKILEWYTTEVV